MEQQFGELQGAVEELQAALGDKDAQIAAYEQDFNAMSEHSNVSWEGGLLGRVRRWGGVGRVGHACRGLPSPVAALRLRR